MSPADQDLTLIHEVLHAYTGKGDIDLAAKLDLVSCPGHNIIGSDPSNDYETESGGANDHGRTTERVEQVGCFTHVARR
jgi:hypothetical protein